MQSAVQKRWAYGIATAVLAVALILALRAVPFPKGGPILAPARAFTRRGLLAVS